MFIDSHAHLEMPQFDEDLDEVIQRASQYGVEAIITVGTNLELSKKALQIAHSYPNVYATVGIHPHDASELSDEKLQELRDLAEDPKVMAVGEIGLDFYWNRSPREKQIEAFRMQIRLARELGKPVVIHDRDAHYVMLSILKEERVEEIGGVVHCFSGGLPLAKECIRLNLSISFPGTVTFKNSARLRHVLINIPKERILLETDSPFLAPVPHRGKRNEPALIRYTAEKVAKILKLPVEELASVVRENTKRFFHLPEVL
jgi:TatD DNase family protein